MIKRLLKATAFSWGLMVITLLISGLPSKSQMLAMAKQTKPPEKSNYEAMRSLGSVLNELKNHYQVNILFELKTVQGITISSTLINTNLSLEENLENVLRSLGLKYKKINRTSYTVLVDKSFKFGATSTERFQENKPQSPAATEYSEKSLVANDNVSNIGNKTEYSRLEKSVKGKVTDASTGESLPGVNVSVKGTTRGTTTDAAGEYSIKAIDDKTTLVFSFIGFQTQEVIVGNRNKVDIRLFTDNKALDEVVVVGYGTQKKGDITGAVSKYKNDKLDEAPVSNLDQALQGKIAGVQIQNTSPNAGATPTIRIRGLSSVNAGANPLVVVDGHPVPDGLSFVNMSDVESVEVLKDAASAAIYGSRGASGVILITTKGGSSTKPKYSFKYSTGIKSAYKVYPIMTTSQYVKRLFEEASIRSKDPGIAAKDLIIAETDRAAYVIENTLTGGPTDWQKAALRDASVKNIQIGVSGGTKDLQYYISGGYQNDQGMTYHSEYEKINILAKIDAKLSNRVKISVNINPSVTKRETPSSEFQDFARWRSFHPIFLNEQTAEFVRANPLYPTIKAGDYAQARYFSGRQYSGLMPDGSTWTSASTVDPFATNNQQPKSVLETRSINSDNYRVMASGDMTVNILPGLDFKTLASGYISLTKGLDFSKRDNNKAGDVNRGVYSNQLYIDLLSENTLNYKKQLRGHDIGILAGFTAQTTNVTNEKITGLDYPSDDITTLNTALSIDKANSFNSKNSIGLLSYLGRLTYGFKSKYLMSASFRADGSSYFALGKKWGYFPSLSVGWVASEEPFLKNINWLGQLKFRGSYGVTGNNRIVDFAFVDLLYNANYPLGTGNGTNTVGQVPSLDILSNPNITWEQTNQFNAGLDIALFQNAVTIALDVYQSKTDRLLLRQAALGFTGVPQTWNNVGSLQNSGVEFEITSYNIKTKDFKWTTSANISHNENKVLELGAESQLLNQGERTELYLNKVGAPLVQFYGYKTNGVWISQTEIEAAKLTSSLSSIFAPGGLKVVDLNGDGKLDANDRTVIGNPYPDFIWGLTNTFKYKGLDLNFMIQGSQGGKLINGDPNYAEIKKTGLTYNTADKWLSPLNPGDGKTPYYNTGFNWMLTDYVVEDASYYSLRELGIGYSLPTQWVKAAKLGGVRFYFTAQNLIFQTAANYRGLNPEARFSSGPYNTPLIDGYQRGAYPMNKTFRVGIDLNF